ncbi:sigma-54-dependent Fis family transcriptional regulator [Acidithiobacillus thiooxidans]|uniref:sigma-54 interaction domain-containing protein n=1 Tax=Acidithiobacillus thiooxidans TaxID=930 RepID=UPI001C067EAA|nr:sigma-54 dependent transcriptional regulator [Acidithiobacillus thiooxidans]MBU2791920.1 sigma-54-dependent Fis family transcriptional regulator [Acidithiobacillus thiooxidans]
MDRNKSKKHHTNIVGESPAWGRILNDVTALSHAPSTVTVFLTGETGTGKEVIARAIHDTSDRAGRMFIPINCAAIPADLLESVLFGHEKGAFTGAYAKSLGKFEQAEGGTILLDEIGEMSFSLQSKLLRVLQEKQVDRIGGREPVPVDVRIIAATHRDLQKKVIDGEFREDLYYRLNVYPIELPPLRERREDISLLVSYAAEKLAKRGYPGIHFMEDALEVMGTYSWPGNVRELMNLVERIAVQCIFNKKEAVTAADLPNCFFDSRQTESTFCSKPSSEESEESLPVQALPEGKTLPEHLLEIERTLILEAIHRTSGNTSSAARKLGVPRSTLLSRIQALSLPKWSAPSLG